ncbi:MAG: hypothetical protein KAT00_11960, partial [Planctomycetes bacterium]|nr:hypothetical protein [Planctomycetota bacterium]
YALISSHYRQNYNFTFDGLKGAEQAIDKINRCLFTLSEAAKGDEGVVRDEITSLIDKSIAGFDDALCDDLNISKALAAVFEFVKEANKLSDISGGEAKALIAAIEKIDSVLGVLEGDSEEEIPAEIMALAAQRKEAKLSKDWGKADQLRAEIGEKGFVIEDMPGHEYRIMRKDV